VLDVMMPEKDGWAVLAEMKASIDPVIAHIPVIMLTARSDDLDRIRGSIEGAIRYLTKPFSPSELREEVRDALIGDPEPMKRHRVQTGALEQLARLESGRSEPVRARAPRPHLTRLERAPEPEPSRAAGSSISADTLAKLSTKQRALLVMVGSTPTVSEAAERMEVSRSNVYASLRRIALKLDVRSVPDLVTLARSGGFPVGL
jgi:DNA-binding NarL/FixJ family response regulator